jgi:hypothetical protein
MKSLPFCLATLLSGCVMIAYAQDGPKGECRSAAAIYAKAAPATALILAGDASGTGIVVDEDGWLITNRHVAVNGPIHIESGVQMVKVFFGYLVNHVMTLDEPGIMAWVCKTSEEKDLALLKLTRLPFGVRKLPCISLATSAGTPGSECIIIGHPKAGMLWTVRQGMITGAGRWPRDMVQTVAAGLGSTGKNAQVLHEALSVTPARKVFVSSCGVNPGDSGGPLLNMDGELLGVTFGTPLACAEQGVSLDKFTYHVHLDEVREFLKDRPAEPQPFIPDPWPSATGCSLADFDKDTIADTLVFAAKKGELALACLCDLNENSGPGFDPARLSEPGMRQRWHFQFAYQRLPLGRTFYDTKNSGQIDVILSDTNGDGIAEIFLKKENGAWKAIPPKGQKMLDPSLFADKNLAARFTDIFRQKASPAGPAKSSGNAPKPTTPVSPQGVR